MSTYPPPRKSPLQFIALVVVVALAATVPAGWKAYNNLRESRLANTASTAARQGRAMEAIRMLEGRIQTGNPHEEIRLAYISAWRARADELANVADFPGAQKAIQTALNLSLPGTGERREAVLHRKTLRHAEAAAIERENPRQASAILVEIGEVPAAVALLARALDFSGAIELATTRLLDPKQILDLRRQQARRAEAASDWAAAASFYAEAADYAATKRSTSTDEVPLRLAAAATAEKAGNWDVAAEQFEKSGEVLQAVGAYIRAGKGKQAVDFIRQRNVPPLTRAEVHQAAGDWSLAEAYYRQANRPEAAIEMWLKAGNPTSAARLAESLGLLVRAIEIHLQAGDYMAAGAVASKAGRSEKVKDFLERVVRDLAASGRAADAAAIITAVKDAVLRVQLLEASRERLSPTTDAADAGALFAAGGDWSEAARRYERANVMRAAADAWQRAGNTKAEGAALRRAAMQESDADLALRAAATLKGDDESAFQEMMDRALASAIVQRLPDTIAEIYVQRQQSLEGATRLLALGELWAGSFDRAARQAHDAAIRLLPKMTILDSVKALYARREALQQKIENLARTLPSVDPSGINYYGIDRYFERTVAHLTITNPGKRVRSATIQIELSGKAPELFQQSATSGIHLPQHWMWSDRRVLETVGRGEHNFMHRQTIADLAPGETRSVSVNLGCRQPYRLIGAWLEDIVTD